MRILRNKFSLWGILLPVLLVAAVSCEETDPLIFEMSGPTTLVIPAEGGSATVTVTAPAPWSTATRADWITISPDSGEAGDVTIQLAAKANQTGSTRSAEVIISGEGVEQPVTVTVTQEAMPAPQNEMKISEQLLEIDPEGGKAVLNVTMSVEEADVTAEISGDDEDVFQAKVSKGDKALTYLVEVSADANWTLEDREAVLTVKVAGQSADVSLRQKFVEPEAKASVERLSVPAEGGEFSFKISMNYAWEFTFGSIPEWVTVEYETEQAEFEVKVTVDPNESQEARRATLLFNIAETVDVEIPVIQEACEQAPLAMTIDPDEITIDPEGGEAWFMVYLNRQEEIEIEIDDMGGIFFEAQVFGFDEDNCAWPVQVKAGPNTMFDNMEGYINVTCGDLNDIVTVRQDALEVVARPSEAWLLVPQAGGVYNFTIDMNYDWDYSLFEKPEWTEVEVTPKEKKLVVNVVVKENPETDAREGVIDFLVGQGTVDVEIPVHQEGTGEATALTMDLNKTELTIVPEGGEASFTVRLNREATLAVSNDQAYFPVDASPDAADPLLWTVTVKADANWSLAPRTGTVSVMAEGTVANVSVSQEAIPVEAVASMKNLVFDPAGGTLSYTIQMNHEWDVALAAVPEWVNLNFEQDGMEIKVSAEVKANETDAAREGLIVFDIADQVRVETPVFQDLKGAEEFTAEVSAKEVNIFAGGGSTVVTVTLNREAVVNAVSSNEQEFRPVTEQDAANPLKWTVTIYADANTTFQKRSANVTITAGDKTETVTVTQEAIAVSTKFSTQSVELDANGGSARVVIEMNHGWDVRLEDVPGSWLSADVVLDGETATLVFSARKNETGEERSATVKVLIGNQTYEVAVSQKPAQTVGDIGGEIGGWEDGGDAGFGKNN